MISQKAIKHYLDNYNGWFKALHNATQLTDMDNVHNLGAAFMNSLTELWHYDLIAITIVERYGSEILESTQNKLNTYYN